MDKRILEYHPGFHSIVVNWQGGGDLKNCEVYFRYEKEIIHSCDTKHMEWAQRIASGFLVNESRPWIMMNGDTPVISNVLLDPEEKQRVLTEGLAVYMYEPIFLKNHMGRRNVEFFNTDLSFEETEKLQKNVGCIELDALLLFFRYNQMKPKTTIYLCDYRLGEFLSLWPRYRDFKFETLDVFLINEALFRKTQAHFFTFKNEPQKSLTCFNFRYEAFREIVVAYLRSKNLHQDSQITFYHQHDSEIFNERCDLPMTSMKHWPDILHGIKIMQSELPYAVDAKNPALVDPRKHEIPDMLEDANMRPEDTTLKIYRNAFLALACETRFFPSRGIITEKTFLPIAAARPFVLVGSPYLLRYMREMGFKTFHNYWDESYDILESPSERMDAILDLVTKLTQIDKKTQRDMLEAMKPDLLYNFNYMVDGLVEAQAKRIRR